MSGWMVVVSIVASIIGSGLIAARLARKTVADLQQTLVDAVDSVFDKPRIRVEGSNPRRMSVADILADGYGMLGRLVTLAEKSQDAETTKEEK